ncbi:MAG TPA: amidohydrolase [Alphaproteobacteria bacterium]|nr:amidohydrolase [Alphaproteobacteria bacterium]
MSILIKGATIMTMDARNGTNPLVGDVFIEGDSISEVGDVASKRDADIVLDGRGRLVMPGLVNAHIHSWETFLKGRYDNMPLEIWMLYAYPILGCSPLSDRVIYLRTMLCGIECLKAGVTTILDDVIEMPGQNLEQLGAVFRAYEVLGVRAGVSGHIINIPLVDTLPYTSELFPPALLSQARRKRPLTAAEFLDFSKEAIRRFHGKADGRLRYVLGPGGPQRCTPDLLIGAHELARAADTAYHLHVLETKVQAVAGREFYGKSLVQHLYDLDVLSERTTMAHSIWVTDADIEMMGAAKSSVVHNPKSNTKLGSGIMPYRKLLEAGVNVALGSDGVASNDTPRMFDVMNLAALLHKVTTPDRSRWPTADEILRCATIGGARSAMLHGEVGSLEPGKKADMIVLNLRSLNFLPLNDIRNQLVYCENGASIERVIVNGEVVVENGSLTRINEADILAEIEKYLPEFQKHYAEIEAMNRAFEPCLERMYRRCAEQQIGINRYGSQPSDL